MELDATHDPAARCWVMSANEPGGDFPLQNLPYGRFRRVASDEPWRIGVAIGDQILDLHLAAEQCPWADAIYPLLEPLAAGDLHAFMELGAPAWKAVVSCEKPASKDSGRAASRVSSGLLPR